jgi:hypothetical protein
MNGLWHKVSTHKNLTTDWWGENYFSRDVANLHCNAQPMGISSRYMQRPWNMRSGLHSIPNYFNISVTSSPNPVNSSWNCSGCHSTNFSTKYLREEKELQLIPSPLKSLGRLINGLLPFMGKIIQKNWMENTILAPLILCRL